MGTVRLLALSLASLPCFQMLGLPQPNNVCFLWVGQLFSSLSKGQDYRMGGAAATQPGWDIWAWEANGNGKLG